MDTPEHVSLYMQGLEMRRKVVGEDYVENALEKGKSDFLRPLQQFATVGIIDPYHSLFWGGLSYLDGKVETNSKAGIRLGHHLDKAWSGTQDTESVESGDVDGTGKMD